MNLYILRHGLAAEPGTPGLASDRQRPLTAKGEKRMRKIARAMKAMELSFDLILSSPLLRAQQTAEIVAEEFKAHKRLELAEALAAEASPKALLEQLDRRHYLPENILLIGHEPFLSSLVSLLLAGRPAVHVELKKGGLGKLALTSLKPGRHATLEWLLTPRQMVLME